MSINDLNDKQSKTGGFTMHSPQYAVAVVGAGPAGLYAAQKLASAGAQVVIFNRDIKPGGLAEYGIYYN